MEPEQVLSTQTVFEGKIVKMRVDTVLLPGGREASREVVEHRPAVVVVPVDSENNVMLVRQYRHPVGHAMLEAPAGLVEEGEHPDDCAQRELQEETGHYSRNLRALGGFWTSPGFCTEFIYAYLARDLVPGNLQPDGDENIQVERIPLSRIGKLIRVGEIEDAKTIAALLMVTCLFSND